MMTDQHSSKAHLDKTILKHKARGELIGHYGILISAQILYLMIALLLSSLFSYSGTGSLNYMIAVAGTSIVTVLLMLLQSGFIYMYLQIARGNKIHVSDLFFCFSNHPDHLILICICLYLLCMAAALPYGLIWYACARAFGAGFTFGASMQPMQYVLFIVLCIAWFFTAIAVNLPFLPVFFLYIDHPAWSSMALLRESRAKMYGYKQVLFRLLLSFIGYGLLIILSLGIGLLWIRPYIGTTLTEFYLELQ